MSVLNFTKSRRTEVHVIVKISHPDVKADADKPRHFPLPSVASTNTDIQVGFKNASAHRVRQGRESNTAHRLDRGSTSQSAAVYRK